MTKLEMLKMLAEDLGATTKKAIADAVAPLQARTFIVRIRASYGHTKFERIRSR
jgi:hypothetical protein